MAQDTFAAPPGPIPSLYNNLNAGLPHFRFTSLAHQPPSIRIKRIFIRFPTIVWNNPVRSKLSCYLTISKNLCIELSE